jgi:hypothetical protein
MQDMQETIKDAALIAPLAPTRAAKDAYVPSHAPSSTP